DSVQEKRRWLQGVVRNATDFDVLVVTSYFDSGRYDQPPEHLRPFQLGTLTASEGENTVMTGVSGGLTYQVDIDRLHSFYFSIGFTNPYLGAYKAGVAPTDRPVDGYNAATKEGGTVESDLYEAKDVDNNVVYIKFRITAEAGH
ncbi:hypothetical protein BDV93DRAFT_419975, partial [Ceratobasidium sp. AG-I]